MSSALTIPGEWERHAACWLAFPYLSREWPGQLDAAQHAIASLCRAIVEQGGEHVRLLVKDQTTRDTARNLIGASTDIEYLTAAYGDCWVRDTLPTFGRAEDGGLGALRFRFNGWGGRFDIPHDDEIGAWVARTAGAQEVVSDLVLEGGALEFNGQTTCLTTASCVLNPNRNPGLTPAAFETHLASAAGVDRVIWLKRGLLHGDHTDGHTDFVARFIGPNTVVCMRAERSDPEQEVLREVEQALRAAGLEVHLLPKPWPVQGPTGRPLPGTYCNFYIANRAVIVPTYGVQNDERALQQLRPLFSDRDVIGLPGTALLSGGGAFHCVTQPEPAP